MKPAQFGQTKTLANPATSKQRWLATRPDTPGLTRVGLLQFSEVGLLNRPRLPVSVSHRQCPSQRCHLYTANFPVCAVDLTVPEKLTRFGMFYRGLILQVVRVAQPGSGNGKTERCITATTKVEKVDRRDKTRTKLVTRVMYAMITKTLGRLMCDNPMSGFSP